MPTTAWSQMSADRAFAREDRARRRARLACRLRRGPRDCDRLPVYDAPLQARRADSWRGPRDIPLDAINGTLEPNRAAQFDPDFRPVPLARTRWERLWMAQERGTELPPISVVPVGDGYAIRDGHHRVSVARARGAVSIAAIVDAA